MNRALPYGLALLTCAAAITFASPPTPTPQSVTPTLLSRVPFPEFKVKSEGHGFEFEAEAKGALDVVVRTHAYAPASSTGWHGHPGPVFISVTEGTLHFYEYDDPTCTPTVVTAPGGYVDTGHGHIAVNQDPVNTAKDVSVIIAPAFPAPFRIDEGFTAPAPYCGF